MDEFFANESRWRNWQKFSPGENFQLYSSAPLSPLRMHIASIMSNHMLLICVLILNSQLYDLMVMATKYQVHAPYMHITAYCDVDTVCCSYCCVVVERM